MLEIRNVSKTYEQDKALNDISITAKEGCVTVLLGPEGSGKSVVCDILCGIMAADKGDVLVNGIDMEKNSIEAKRHIGYMPQDPAVFRDMTPRGQLKFIGQVHEMSARALNERVEKVIRETRLSEVADRPIRLLPDAYQQRIAIAQAVMGNAENIIIDTPSKPLDAKQRCELRAILEGIIPGHTVLLATDNLTEAEMFGDKVYLMDKGRIVGKADMDKLSALKADAEKTVMQIAADIEQVKNALDGASLKYEDISEEDGIVSVTIKTGLGVAGKKEASVCMMKAALPVIDMRPVERSIDEIILQLENESLLLEGAETE